MLKKELLLGNVPYIDLPFAAVKKIPQEDFSVMFTVLSFKTDVNRSPPSLLFVWSSHFSSYAVTVLYNGCHWHSECHKQKRIA